MQCDVSTGVTGALSTGRVSANMPWKPPRLSLVRDIFEGDEKLARRSVWAAMLAGRTAPSGEEESARSFRGVQSVVPGAWGGVWRRMEERTSGSKAHESHFLMEMEE